MFPATHAVCFGTPVGILEFSIPDFTNGGYTLSLGYTLAWGFWILLRSLPSRGTDLTPTLEVTSVWTNHGVCIGTSSSLTCQALVERFHVILLKGSRVTKRKLYCSRILQSYRAVGTQSELAGQTKRVGPSQTSGALHHKRTTLRRSGNSNIVIIHKFEWTGHHLRNDQSPRQSPTDIKDTRKRTSWANYGPHHVIIHDPESQVCPPKNSDFLLFVENNSMLIW